MNSDKIMHGGVLDAGDQWALRLMEALGSRCESVTGWLILFRASEHLKGVPILNDFNGVAISTDAIFWATCSTRKFWKTFDALCAMSGRPL